MLALTLAKAILTTSIVICTIVGNLFVICAILFDKSLRANSQNNLVLSLAVADLLVASLVMPLAGIYQLTGEWLLGIYLCDVWTSADVFCCTASILNLLAIAIDRYFAVTRVDYIYKRTKTRVNVMIALAWSAAALVSLAPLVGWKDAQFAHRVLNERKCLVSQDVAYQVFATVCTYYAPLVVLLLLYWRIFKVARERIRLKATRRVCRQTNLTNSSNKVLPMKRANISDDDNYNSESNNQQTSNNDDDDNHQHSNINNNNNSNNNNKTAVNQIDDDDDEIDDNCANQFDSQRATHIKRKFRALSQLIGFVQTSNCALQAPMQTTSDADAAAAVSVAVTAVSATALLQPTRVVDAAQQLCALQPQATQLASVACNTPTDNATVTTTTTNTNTTNTTTSATLTQTSTMTQTTQTTQVAESAELKREKKAAKILALVSGSFVMCWLPFFANALIMPLCQCAPSEFVQFALLWLGYSNSLLNPVIYTVFSPDFRRAFRALPALLASQLSLACRNYA